MNPMKFEWLPIFCKEVFADEIKQYQLISFNEDATGIAFKNDYLYFGIFIDNIIDICCQFRFIQENTNEFIEISKLSNFNKHAKETYKKGMYDIHTKRYVTPHDTIKSQILLCHGIIKSHYLDFFKGIKPGYYEQVIKARRNEV